MPVIYRNAQARVYRPDGTEIVPLGPVNMQKINDRKAPPQYQGMSLDERPSFRIRVDVPRDPADPTQPSPFIPTKGDVAFVSEFPRFPALLGIWEIDLVEDDTGGLASIVLYVKRPTLKS